MLAFDRSTNLSRLSDEYFDVVVVGAGITGAGCALDAATRGLRVALIDRGDFASGTSSKSSKMVHGGLRYLQQGEIGLVYEALAERQRLLRNAPHLVRIMPHLIPLFGSGGVIPKKLSKAFGSALWTYDLTGGARIGKLHQRISADEALERAPTLNAEKLGGAYLYYDALTDDARLTLTLARTAASRGAAVANYVGVTGFQRNIDGRIRGVDVSCDGDAFTISTGSVINATGIWADDLLGFASGEASNTMRPAKGVHLTVPLSLVGNTVAVSGLATRDKRSVFVVPWGDQAYIGTTDTDFDGDADHPTCTPADVEYLLDGFNRWFTTHLTPADVTGTWAGLRPLVQGAAPAGAKTKRTADLSRRHAVSVSVQSMITVAGGKLTTYRAMASDTVDVALEVLGERPRPCRTKKVALLGAAPDLAQSHLAQRYGSEAAAVERLMSGDAALAEPLASGSRYLQAEVVHAVRNEMARSLDDVLERRTQMRFRTLAASAEAAPRVAELLRDELGWSPAETSANVSAYLASVAAERAASALALVR